jgi:Phospholipase_D-nuclease N-terminal
VIVGDGFFAVLWIAVWIYGAIDALFAESARVRVMPKAVWVILILLFSCFAAIPWFIWGRPKRTVGSGPTGVGFRRPGQAGGRVGPTAGGWQLGGAPPGRRSGPTAPDDDPDFLRGLGRKRDEPGGDTDRPS